MPTARIWLPPLTSFGDFPGTVPALTAGSIAEVSPVVGATLTVTGSNAPSGSTILWQVDTGSGYGPAGGINNASTYNTTGQPAGTYRRGVSTPAQAMVYTAGVAVSAVTSQVTLINSATVMSRNTTQGGSNLSATSTYTATGGTNNCVVVIIESVVPDRTDPQDVDWSRSKIFYGSTEITFTMQWSGLNTGGERIAVLMAYLMNPPATAQTGRVEFYRADGTTLEAVSCAAMQIVELGSVNASTPRGATNGASADASSAGTSHSITTTGTTGSMIVTGVAIRDGDNRPFTPVTDMTELIDAATGTASFDVGFFVGHRSNVSAGTYAVGATPNNAQDSASRSMEFIAA